MQSLPKRWALFVAANTRSVGDPEDWPVLFLHPLLCFGRIGDTASATTKRRLAILPKEPHHGQPIDSVEPYNITRS
jgi:hypothetical protein